MGYISGKEREELARGCLGIGKRKGGAHAGLGPDRYPVTDRFGEAPDQVKAKPGPGVDAAAFVIQDLYLFFADARAVIRNR